MNITATLDRETKDYAILCVSDGRVFDIYGDTWTEMVEEADIIAAHEGIIIENYNSELPLW